MPNLIDTTPRRNTRCLTIHTPIGREVIWSDETTPCEAVGLLTSFMNQGWLVGFSRIGVHLIHADLTACEGQC